MARLNGAVDLGAVRREVAGESVDAKPALFREQGARISGSKLRPIHGGPANYTGENRMKKILISGVCLAISGAAWAQVMVEDSDGDGVYSAAEIRAAYPDVTDDLLVQIDVNEDGFIDPDELAAAADLGLLGG